MTDIIERLERICGVASPTGSLGELLRDAADEIKRLRSSDINSGFLKALIARVQRDSGIEDPMSPREAARFVLAMFEAELQGCADEMEPLGG